MKKILIPVIIIGLFVLTSCGFWGVRGSGRVKEETRQIENFTNIDASGAFSIKIKVGPEPSLKILAEDNLLKMIRTTVKGNTLIVDSKKSISPRKEIRIYVTTPDLQAIECSGANSMML
jgi:hypothetical protein